MNALDFAHSCGISPIIFLVKHVMVISPVICGAKVPPRLCDPPCSEKQAGIGPISQKPELLTMGRTYNGRSDTTRFNGPP